MSTSTSVAKGLATKMDSIWANEAFADRVAIISGEDLWTYRDLGLFVSARKEALRALGIGKGTRVGFLLGANLEWVVTYYALVCLGAVSVPINTTWTAHELRNGLQYADVEVLIVQPEFKGNNLFRHIEQAIPGLVRTSGRGVQSAELPFLRSVLVQNVLKPSDLPGYVRSIPSWRESNTSAASAPVGELELDEDSIYLLTSGSTAFPKPVIHTQGSLAFAFEAFAEMGNVEPDDIWLLTGTTYHVSAYIGLVVPHLRGATVVLMEFFTPDGAMELIERHKVNTMWGFDTHFTAMYRHPGYQSRDTATLKKIWLGSNPATFDEVRKLRADWHGNIYGNSETVACVSFFPYRLRSDLHAMQFSHGVPAPGVEVLIVDPVTGEELAEGERGEICVSGPQVFKGYYRMPDETEKSFLRPGVHRTGDQGWKDSNGFVYFVGRYKEILKSGGENVSIAEVEQSLKLNIQGIEASVVVGVPDERWGEKIVAFVELRAGFSATSDELRELARPFLAGYKLPKNFLVIESDDWIVTPTGKVDRKALTQKAIQMLSE